MALRSYIDPAENREARRKLPRLQVKSAGRPTTEPRDMSTHVPLLGTNSRDDFLASPGAQVYNSSYAMVEIQWTAST